MEVMVPETFTVADLAEEIYTLYNLSKKDYSTIKIIVRGNILNSNEKLTTHFIPSAENIVVFLPEKNTTGRLAPAPAPAPVPAPVPALFTEEEPCGSANLAPAPEKTGEFNRDKYSKKNYSLAEIMLSFGFLIQVVRQNKYLHDLYMNDLDSLLQLMNDELGFADKTAEFLKELPRLKAGISSFDSTIEFSETRTVPTYDTPQPSVAVFETDVVPPRGQYIQDHLQEKGLSLVLSRDDENNIQTLLNTFPDDINKDIATDIYLRCNRNFTKAVNFINEFRSS
uniref:Ubiquitin-like domain-containing protein n=1 Tax=viral metagenome TaxID=1070528 RepID=A0A6C0EAW8_9ZZZZ